MHLRLSVLLLTAAAHAGCDARHGASSVPPTPVPARVRASQSSPSPASSPASPLRPGDGASDPVIVSSPQPVVPASSVRRQIGGGAFVFEAIVSATGRVESLRTVRQPSITPPWPELEEAARQAVLSWQFKPAIYEGHPVAVYLTVSVGFHW